MNYSPFKIIHQKAFCFWISKRWYPASFLDWRTVVNGLLWSLICVINCWNIIFLSGSLKLFEPSRKKFLSGIYVQDLFKNFSQIYKINVELFWKDITFNCISIIGEKSADYFVKFAPIAFAFNLLMCFLWYIPA